MRKLVAVLLSLLALASHADSVRAQSGRNRPVPTAGRPNDNSTNQPPAGEVSTGGRLYKGNSVVNISQAFAWVAEELRRQYSLGYYPKAGARADERRRIKVEVGQTNLVVQARDSYIYSPTKTEAEGAQEGQSSSPR